MASYTLICIVFFAVCSFSFFQSTSATRTGPTSTSNPPVYAMSEPVRPPNNINNNEGLTRSMDQVDNPSYPYNNYPYSSGQGYPYSSGQGYPYSTGQGYPYSTGQGYPYNGQQGYPFSGQPYLPNYRIPPFFPTIGGPLSYPYSSYNPNYPYQNGPGSYPIGSGSYPIGPGSSIYGPPANGDAKARP